MSARRFLSAAILAAACAASGCAADVPGVSPPNDRLHFPMGLAVVPGSTPDKDVLVVVSSNFDQRYNAGSLTSLSIDGMFAKLPPAGSATASAPAFISDLTGLIVDHKRILQLGSEAVAVKLDAAPAPYGVFTVSRGRNRLTMAYVDDGRITCAAPNQALIAALDCSDSFVMPTQGFDPIALAYSEENGVLAIAHLRVEQADVNSPIYNIISLVKPADFVARAAMDHPDTSQDKIVPLAFVGGGVTGLSFVPGAGPSTVTTDLGTLVTAGRVAPSNIINLPTGVTSYALIEQSAKPSLRAGPIMALNIIDAVDDLRGLVTASTAPSVTGLPQARAYATVRFADVSGRVSSGIAVIAVEGAHSLQLISTLQVGDELGRPFLVERTKGLTPRRFLYVPDSRNDAIYVIDASSDQPVLITRIEGRWSRDVNGASVLAHTLDGPVTIAFLERGGRKLAFVSNFTNSTISVLDVGDEDPANHRVIARFGRATQPGSTEQEPGQ